MKRNSFIFLAPLLFSCLQMSAYADHCYSAGIGSFCYFTGLSNSASEHAYFHCETSGTPFVKMYNHNVLISGFMPVSGAGAGTLTLTGLGVKKMLDDYYFEVMHHEGHSGIKYVLITSLGPMKCSLGTGGRKGVFPGSFGISPEKE
jgi:hypothetical protein